MNAPAAIATGSKEGPSPWRRVRAFLWRWFARCMLAFAAVLLLYIFVVLVGLIPVNNNFRPDGDGVEILLTSNAVHADLVLPLTTEQIDWRGSFPQADFAGDCSAATHVAIGWGDQGFFINTPTWADLRASTAARALFWPSATCLHVVMTRDEYYRSTGRSVKISPEQYAALVTFINASFRESADGKKRPIAGAAYHDRDAFYEARGTYHCLNTCNSWVGRALAPAGIRTPLLTPLPKTVFLYLPE